MYTNTTINNQPYCINCNKVGHSYKKCLEPVISVGIICFYFDGLYLPEKSNCNYIIKNSYDTLSNIYKNKNFLDKNIKYCMICRRHSIGYVDIVRGKYSFNNLSYFKYLLSMLTNHEINLLLNWNFKEIWKDLWITKDLSGNDFSSSELKFKLLKNGVKFESSNQIIKLNNILNKNNNKWNDPEWGFPKGRRNNKENNVNCAIREFCEETGVDADEFDLLDMHPFYEIYKSENNVRYKHIYYIAQFNNKYNIENKEIFLNDYEDNLNQYVEVSKIKWCDIKNSNDLIRDYSVEKKKIINKIHNKLCRIISSNY